MKKIVIAITLLVMSLFSLWHVFDRGYFPMHDDAQVARVVVMSNALKNGQFPVRMVGDLGYGYGYPLFNFYGPLPYYTGGLLYMFGVDGITAVKVMMVIGVFIGALALFLLVSSMFGTWSGLVSAGAFLFVPYRAVQLFVRGAVGELWATSFIPFIILGFLLLNKKETKLRGLGIGVLGIFGVICSHTVLGYITMVFLGIYLVSSFFVSMIHRKKLPSSFIPQVAMVILALDLSAFFWLPALFEMSYTNVSSVIGPSADFRNHFVCFFQLWDSLWGYGGSAPGCLDGMSFKLGKAHVLLALVSIVAFLFWKKKNKDQILLLIVSLVLFFVSVFFLLPLSKPIWEVIPFFSFVQYPWRMLSFTAVAMAVFIGIGIVRLSFKKRVIAGCVVIGLLAVINWKLFCPQYSYIPVHPGIFESKEDIRFRASTLSDEYLPSDIVKPESEKEALKERVESNDTVEVRVLSETETTGTYTVQSSVETELPIRIAYFPGWQFFLDGNNVDPIIEGGTVNVVVSEGNQVLEVLFTDTPIRIIANTLSLVTVVLILLFYAKEAIH